jgi:hypothetical protein
MACFARARVGSEVVAVDPHPLQGPAKYCHDDALPFAFIFKEFPV